MPSSRFEVLGITGTNIVVLNKLLNEVFSLLMIGIHTSRTFHGRLTQRFVYNF